MESSEIFKLILTVIFYGAVATLSLLSMLTIYIYVRYGQAKIMAVVISLVYIFLFTAMVSNAYRLFTNLTV